VKFCSFSLFLYYVVFAEQLVGLKLESSAKETGHPRFSPVSQEIESSTFTLLAPCEVQRPGNWTQVIFFMKANYTINNKKLI